MSVRPMIVAVAVTGLPFAAAPALAVQNANLVLHYTFDDPTEIVEDTTGNGNDGTLVRSTPANPGDPVYPSYTEEGEGALFRWNGRAMDFGPYGNSAYIDVMVGPTFASMTENDAYTISWFQLLPAGAPSGQVQFRAANSADDRVIGVHAPWANGQIYHDINYGSGSPLRSRVNDPMPDSWTDPVWTHVTLVKDGDSSSIYVDGIYVDGAASGVSALLDIEDFAIGAAQGGDVAMGGLMDDFAIWNVALNEDQINVVKRFGVLPKISEPSTVALIGCASIALITIRGRNVPC